MTFNKTVMESGREPESFWNTNGDCF